MTKEQIMQYYRRFRQWQLEGPRYVNRHQGTTQHCHNCGTEFSGNFCPICGQRAKVGRVGWKSIRESVEELWGINSRSLPNTLVQLLGRPGYLVCDYISGRRQVSYPPVNLLVLVCLFVVVVESVFHVNNDVVGLKFNVQELDDIVAWINAQKSWATLLLQSFYILPTWLVFRYAPGYPQHTLPEGFYLQVYLSVLSLLTTLFIGYWNENLDLALFIIYMYITYYQLFGYSWWGTLWRMAVLFLLAVTAMILSVVILSTIYVNDGIHDMIDALESILIVLPVAALLTAIILYVTHRINKRTYHKNIEEGGIYRPLV